MKNLLLILSCLLMTQVLSASENLYFLMDDNPEKKYSKIISEYHGYEIQTFNIYLDKEKSILAVFTILPSYKDIHTHWGKINLDTLKNNVLTKDSLLNIYAALFHQSNGSGRIHPSLSEKNTGQFKITNGVRTIIRTQEGYYVNESKGILEFFSIKHKTNKGEYDYPSMLFPSENRVFEINIHSPINAIYEFEARCKEIYNTFSINHPTNKESNHTYYKPFMLRDRDTILLENQQAYRFWTFGNWELHGNNFNRGVDRLTYIEGIGIVAGAYTDYFMQPFYARLKNERYSQSEQSEWEKWIEYDYLHDIQSTPLRIEVNGKVVYEK